MKNFDLFFFDWDGTLCSDRFWKSLRKEDTKIKAVIEDFFENGGEGRLRAWMLGKITSETVNVYISEKADYPFDDLWKIFVKDCQEMFFSPILREQILKLKKRAKTVLVTGNMDSFRRFTVPTLQLENYFDRIIVSSEVGFLKDENNGEIFKKEAEGFGIPIKNSILIDDSEKCCRVFSETGGMVLKTLNPNHTVKILKIL